MEIKEISKELKLNAGNGGLGATVTDNLYGLNMLGSRSGFELNSDIGGYTFFTRPLMNLSLDNIRTDPFLSQLATSTDGINKYVRMVLDPKLYFKDIVDGKHTQGLRSKLIDNSNPFITILSNTLDSISGFPDLVLPTYNSSPGVRKEQWGYGDGPVDIFNTYDIDTNFLNIREEPLSLLMQTWATYISRVYDGTINPYINNQRRREVDYNTRIYRIITGVDGHTIKKIGAIGAGFPKNVPMGQFFDYSYDTPLASQSKKLNFRFEAYGAIYNDYRLMLSFNMTVAMFNPEAAAIIHASPPFKRRPDLVKQSNLVEVPREYMTYLNHRAIPIIDIENTRLRWYISKEYLTVEKIKEFTDK
jgi:hypothetical protein